MSRKLKYIIAVLVLLAANLWLLFSDSSTSDQTSKKYFEESDLDRASRFLFIKESDTVKLELTGEGWIVNNQYSADKGFVNTLISILSRVETGRSIENWDNEIIGKAEVEFDFNSRYRFAFASNPTRTKSYFVVDGAAIEVSVPGYRDLVVDLFELHPDQWRERLIVDGSWRSIQQVSVTEGGDETLNIHFQDKFFLVNNKPPADSSAVVEYLNQFQQFQANEMISNGRFPEFDSLATTNPIALVSIEDIKNEEPTELFIYPNLPNQAYHLVVDKTGKMMVIDARRVASILRSPMDFTGK